MGPWTDQGLTTLRAGVPIGVYRCTDCTPPYKMAISTANAVYSVLDAVGVELQ